MGPDNRIGIVRLRTSDSTEIKLNILRILQLFRDLPSKTGSNRISYSSIRILDKIDPKCACNTSLIKVRIQEWKIRLIRIQELVNKPTSEHKRIVSIAYVSVKFLLALDKESASLGVPIAIGQWETHKLVTK